MYNAPLGMLKTVSVTDIVESQESGAVPVIHHAARVIVGFLAEVPRTASCVVETVDRMMESHKLAARYVSLAETRNGRRFVLAHD